MKEISLYDKTVRELECIKTVYGPQIDVQTKGPFMLPNFANEVGKSCESRYLLNCDVLSNTEIFNLQGFKIEMEKRYELAVNKNLLKAQLKELRQRASTMLDLYNVKLSEESPAYKAIIEKAKDDKTLFDHHQATIEIIDYRVWCIHFGTNLTSINKGFLHQEKYIQYLSTNRTLALFCFNLIEFIDMFRIVDLPKPNCRQ